MLLEIQEPSPNVRALADYTLHLTFCGYDLGSLWGLVPEKLNCSSFVSPSNWNVWPSLTDQTRWLVVERSTYVEYGIAWPQLHHKEPSRLAYLMVRSLPWSLVLLTLRCSGGALQRQWLVLWRYGNQAHLPSASQTHETDQQESG